MQRVAVPRTPTSSRSRPSTPLPPPAIRSPRTVRTSSYPTQVATSTRTPSIAPSMSNGSASTRATETYTPAEHYWAARALTAETMLSAKAMHEKDVKRTAYDEETKRARELAAIRSEHKQQIRRMEIFLGIVVTLLVATLAGLGYIYASAQAEKPAASRWSLPAHFTIPILSPFTSVIENETSTMSTRLIVAVVAVLSILAFAIFWCWGSRPRRAPEKDRRSMRQHRERR